MERLSQVCAKAGDVSQIVHSLCEKNPYSHFANAGRGESSRGRPTTCPLSTNGPIVRVRVPS